MFRKSVKFLSLVILASPLLAQANVITTNKAQTARQIMNDQGASQSDWGQTRKIHCLEMNFDGKTSLFRCLGEYRSLGPGGGGDFWFGYQCDIPFHVMGTRQFQVIDNEVQCQ